MYLILESEIIKQQLNKKEIAKSINRRYETFTLKIKGKYPFTYDEAVKIQETFFPNLDIKYLFHKSQQSQQAV